MAVEEVTLIAGRLASAAPFTVNVVMLAEVALSVVTAALAPRNWVVAVVPNVVPVRVVMLAEVELKPVIVAEVAAIVVIVDEVPVIVVIVAEVEFS